LTFADPKSQINFILHPLSRGNAYSLRWLILTCEGKERPGEINLSSPQAVCFANLPTVAELVEASANCTHISVEPLRISLGGLARKVVGSSLA
jgi:hypothetical protein